MTETIPEGPTDPRLSMPDDGTTVMSPGYGAPLHTGGTAPIPYSRPPIVPGPPGPVGSPIVPVTEQLDEHPSGRIYTSEPQREPEPAPEIGADRGKTTITDDVVDRVIKKIVDLTVDEVAGVDALVPLGGGESDDGLEPVVVRLEGDQVEIDIAIRVAFGHVVHEVVDKTRASVISQTERLLGLTVTDVNVTVGDVSFEPDE